MAVQRDTDWFEQLYAANYAMVLAYARRRGDGSVAQDVAAETFAIAWRRRHAVPDHATGWLLGVARRVLANQARGARRRNALAERLSSAAPAAIWDQELTDGDPPLVAALSQLSNIEREALLLVAWEGLTPKELSAALGCSPVAARLRLHRARQKLRAALKPHPAAQQEGAMT